ncbi:Mis12-Mtw1 protein family-domain-containing protein [Ilyonectria sp. MPI-CAGE-AT-0026]|nr:Mis12-Mtw1 protein family-domain-containing protein [Ilyonectria sp. MPI-CAGE-AT-0026]
MTLVTTRRPLRIINTSNQAEQRTSKRAADGLHDEHTMQGMLGAGGPITAIADCERDDDFQFVRKREEPALEPLKISGRGRAVKEHVTQDLAPVDQGMKEITATIVTTEPVITKPTRKSLRQKPNVNTLNEKPLLKVSKRGIRRSARISGEKPGEEIMLQINSISIKRGCNTEEAPKRPVPNWDKSPPPRAALSKITLPISDMPVINQNKKMHIKNDRTSSLIDGGQSAIPYREVNPADFFKYIEALLLKPQRIKELLTWCSERSLSEKPPYGTPNAHGILDARTIQDQLLKDFAARPEFSDWFSRDDSIPKAPQAIRKPPPKPPLKQPPLFNKSKTGRIVLPDFNLLDPEEGQIRGYLADETTSFEATRSQIELRLRNIQSSLKFQVDQLANNIHALEQRVLRLQLRQREEREKAKVGGTQGMPVMEVLRSLGSIHPEGRGRRENQELKAKEATKKTSKSVKTFVSIELIVLVAKCWQIVRQPEWERQNVVNSGLLQHRLAYVHSLRFAIHTNVESSCQLIISKRCSISEVASCVNMIPARHTCHASEDNQAVYLAIYHKLKILEREHL